MLSEEENEHENQMSDDRLSGYWRHPINLLQTIPSRKGQNKQKQSLKNIKKKSQ